MTIWDWLTTPTGIELTHAFILVLVAGAAWLQQRTHDQLDRVSRKLDDHIASVPKLPVPVPGSVEVSGTPPEGLPGPDIKKPANNRSIE